MSLESDRVIKTNPRWEFQVQTYSQNQLVVTKESCSQPHATQSLRMIQRPCRFKTSVRISNHIVETGTWTNSSNCRQISNAWVWSYKTLKCSNKMADNRSRVKTCLQVRDLLHRRPTSRMREQELMSLVSWAISSKLTWERLNRIIWVKAKAQGLGLLDSNFKELQEDPYRKEFQASMVLRSRKHPRCRLHTLSQHSEER